MRPLDPRLVRRSRLVRRHLVVSVLLGVVTASLVVGQAVLAADVVSRAVVGASLGLVPVLLVAVLLARALVRWAHTVAAARAAATLKARLRRDVVDDVLDPRRQTGGPSSGRVVTLLGPGLDAFDGYVGRFLPQVVLTALVPPLVVAVIAVTDPWSAVVVGLTLPLVVVFLVLVGLLTRDRVDRRWQAMERLGRHFGDVLDGLVLLKVFGRRQEQGLREVGDRHRRESVRALRLAFLSSFVLDLFSTLAVALVAVSVGLRVLDGQLALEPALLVLLLAPEAFVPLRQLGAHFHDSTEGAEAAGAVLDLLDRDRHHGTAPAPDLLAADLVLDAVEVWHEGRTRPSLAVSHTRIRPGEMVAVTGPSGVGKSTLLALLLGLQSPTRGYVLVGDRDLADVDPAAWRARVAWVPQVPALVDGTVEDNVRLGDLDATRADVEDALRAAGAGDLGLQRRVGETITGVSAGERRRIAVARALLRVRAGRADLLLLDEPTAGLDATREAAVLATLRGLAVTVVVVAHRPETVAAADREMRLVPAGDRSVGVPVAGATRRPKDRCAATPRATDLSTSALPPRRRRRKIGGLALGRAVGVLGQLAAAGLLLTSAWLVVRASEQPPVLYLMVAIVGVRFFGLSRAALRYVERLLTHDAAFARVTEARVAVYRSLDRVAPAGLGGRRRGDLVSRVVSDVDAVQDRLLRVRGPWVVTTASVVVVVLVVGWLAPPAGLVLAVAAAVAMVVVRRVVPRRARRERAAVAGLRGSLAAEVAAAVRAAPDLVVHGATAAPRSRVAASTEALARAECRAAWWGGAGQGVVLAVTALATGVVAVLATDVPAVLVGVLVLAPLALVEPLDALADAERLRPVVDAAEERLHELDTVPVPVVEPARPAPLPRRSDLVARGLVVGWDQGATAPVDLVVREGEAVVVTGPSGAGKTTLALTLARLLEPRAGTVTLGGVALPDLAAADVRRVVGYLAQDEVVLDTSIRENLRVADPAADDAAMLAALAAAGLADLVASLPDGLDTTVGERGDRLSGGERQRLCLARLLLADHRVLVVDEPTEHLDEATADALVADLLALCPERSVVVVSHAPRVLAAVGRSVTVRPAGSSDASRDVLRVVRPGVPAA